MRVGESSRSGVRAGSSTARDVRRSTAMALLVRLRASAKGRACSTQRVRGSRPRKGPRPGNANDVSSGLLARSGNPSHQHARHASRPCFARHRDVCHARGRRVFMRRDTLEAGVRYDAYAETSFIPKSRPFMKGGPPQ